MKKKKSLKAIFVCLAVSVTAACAVMFGGCFSSNAKNGVNGKDLNIYDLYEAAKAESGNADMTMDEFLKEYLSYSSSELDAATSLTAAVNRSLMSAVSVVSSFRTGFAVETSGAGSGVIIDIDREKGDMTVLTNCHVVYSAEARSYGGDGFSDSISVWLYGSESPYITVNSRNAIPATIIAASKAYDAALLKIENSELVKSSKAIAANWTSKEDVYLGETVFALGNASSDTISANVGYVSKDIERITVNLGSETKPEDFDYNVIRTSAHIYGGNSGGGLFDINGELVGLVNARSSKTENGETSVGYALTASSTKRVVQRMLQEYNGTETHGVRRAKHGISVIVTDMYSTGLNDKGLAEIYEEVTVASALLGPASGKFKYGDVIKHVKITRGTTVVEDMEIRREHSFHDVMLSIASGDTVEITIARGGVTLENPISFTVSENNFETV